MSLNNATHPPFILKVFPNAPANRWHQRPSKISIVRNLLTAAAALFALSSLGCKVGSADLAAQGGSEPIPLPAGQSIKSDLVGTWAVSGTEVEVKAPGKGGEVKKTTYDGDGTSTYKADGTFSSELSKGGYDINMLGNYTIDGSRATLVYTKIDLKPPKDADEGEVFKLKPMIQQALNLPANGVLAFKGKNSATITFGDSIETLVRKR